MIHDPCEGLDLRACETCVRHIDRCTPEQLAQHKTRHKPYAIGGHCIDHLELPERAADASHDKL